MTSKHVFTSSDGLVLKALRGATALNHDLCLHEPSKTIYSQTLFGCKVAVIAGGGAGHEPAYSGYTGRGMLAAGVSGDIFASPSSSQILTCIKLALRAQAVSKVLIVVNNYTGDRLNFGLAAEQARSMDLELSNANESIQVETVVVADDVSLRDHPSLVGARGLAGNILMCKIMGSAAEAGRDLDQLKSLGEAVTTNLASIGVGLAHCHVPGREHLSEEVAIKDGMCELGLGLHNEPGVHRVPLASAESLIKEMLGQVLFSSRRSEKIGGGSGLEGRLKSSIDTTDDVILFVNNLGGISLLEMNAIVDEAVEQLGYRGIRPVRVLCSSYMTSLNAPGFSLTLLNLSSASRDAAFSVEDIIAFVDAPTTATAWQGVRTGWLTPNESDKLRKERVESDDSFVNTTITTADTPEDHAISWRALDIESSRVQIGIRRACEAILEVEKEMTQFDTILGDGDCGETFASGARAVLEGLDHVTSRESGPVRSASVLSKVCNDNMGGTSGALFGIYLTALSNAFRAIDLSSKENASSTLHSAPIKALEALETYTPARPGDRTLVDALYPFCRSLADGQDLSTAAAKAFEGAQKTKGMVARLGRATYVHSQGDVYDGDEKERVPDPGAWGVAALVRGFQEGLKAA